MKRRFAYKKDDNYKQIRLDNKYLHGYVCYLKFKKLKEPLIVDYNNKKICIKDNEYEWIMVYPDNAKYAITIMFDNKENLIEWYFDISFNVGIENGIPYEDDLYLDLVITPKGKKIILDEDELLDAKNRDLITENDVKSAYDTLNYLEKIYYENFSYLNYLTNYLVSLFKDGSKIK